MKRVKTADLTGPALDWAVAKCAGREIDGFGRHGVVVWELDALTGDKEACCLFTPSTHWAQGGPLVDVMIETHGLVFACRGKTVVCSLPFSIEHQEWFGATPLIAAMRCFVTKALGDEVDVPDELV